MRMLIASPSPVPPSCRVRFLFTCSNSVNIDARSRSERPIPLSMISKTKRVVFSRNLSSTFGAAHESSGTSCSPCDSVDLFDFVKRTSSS